VCSLEREMSKAPYNSEKINDYLLGSLSAEETEPLDELSITDAAFAEALIVAESELIDAYVLNELDAQTRRKFENRYLATPIKREKVKFAETLQQFGSRQQARVTPYAAAPGWLSWLKSQFGRQSILQWGFAAAALVLSAAVVWLAFQNIRLRSEMLAIRAHNNELAQSQQQLQKQLEEAQRSAQARVETPVKTDQGEIKDHPASSAVLSLVLTPLLRGAQQKPTLNLAGDTTAVTVKVVLEPNDFSSYRVELLAEGQGPVWRAVNLKPQARNGAQSLALALPVRVLKANNYVLRISGTDKNGASEVVGDYPFTINKTNR